MSRKAVRMSTIATLIDVEKDIISRFLDVRKPWLRAVRFEVVRKYVSVFNPMLEGKKEIMDEAEKWVRKEEEKEMHSIFALLFRIPVKVSGTPAQRRGMR